MLKAIRNGFITGLILLLPLGVTLMFGYFLINKIGAPMREVFFFFLDPATRKAAWVNPVLDLTSLLVVIALITTLGWLSKYFLGRFLVRTAEHIVNAVPFINTIYRTVKQIVDTFSKDQSSVFKKVVLFEYPRKGIWSLGFLTSIAKGETQDKTKEDVVNIFLPTTPNPTSGYLLMIPKADIIEMDMSISDGIKLIISGGALTPSENKHLKSKTSNK